MEFAGSDHAQDIALGEDAWWAVRAVDDCRIVALLGHAARRFGQRQVARNGEKAAAQDLADRAQP
jgi:hypothetical protein